MNLQEALSPDTPSIMPPSHPAPCEIFPEAPAELDDLPSSPPTFVYDFTTASTRQGVPFCACLCSDAVSVHGISTEYA